MRHLIKTTTLSAAVLVSATALAQQQQLTGTGQFCLKGPNGPVQCQYETMAQCEQARPAGSTDQCLSRSQVTATGGAAPRENPAPGVPSPSNPQPE